VVQFAFRSASLPTYVSMKEICFKFIS